MPTREDVLAVRSIEEAFDLSTTTIKKREVALIRVAATEGLIFHSLHAIDAEDDEQIPKRAVDRVVAEGTAVSKDVDIDSSRRVGINFQGVIRGRRRIRAKVSWDDVYYIPTVHTIAS